MDPVSIALLAGTAVKGISGWVKNRRGKKLEKSGEAQMNKALANIKYSRPDEYKDIMSLLGQRSSRINTQRDMAESRVRESTVSGISGIRQLADSPVAALGAYGGLKEREQQAIADLGVAFEGKRDEALMGQVQGLQMGADYSDKEQYYNDMYKNMVKANLGASKMESGINQRWGGAEEIASAGLDFIGTKYLSKYLNPKAAEETRTMSDEEKLYEDMSSAGMPS